MFTDISLAEDLNTKFSDFLKSSSVDVGINYFVRVLQQGAWPLSQNNLSPLNIPVELEKTVSMYEKFYAKQFNGRKLTWLHHLSNGDIKLGYLSKTYIINMTTFQVRIYNIDFWREVSNFFSDVHPASIREIRFIELQ